MPEMDGLTATRMIVSRHPSVRVVALTTFARRDIVVEAILAGAAGYLLKESEPEAVIAGVRAVMAGQVTVSPEIARGVVETFSAQVGGKATPRQVDMNPVELSNADDDVLKLLAEGLSNAVIAEELCLSQTAYWSSGEETGSAKPSRGAGASLRAGSRHPAAAPLIRNCRALSSTPSRSRTTPIRVRSR